MSTKIPSRDQLTQFFRPDCPACQLVNTWNVTNGFLSDQEEIVLVFSVDPITGDLLLSRGDTKLQITPCETKVLKKVISAIYVESEINKSSQHE